METMLSSRQKSFNSSDVVFIVGKGKRSEDRPVLMPAILQLLLNEYGIPATIDEENTGRIRVSYKSIDSLVEKKKWKF